MIEKLWVPGQGMELHDEYPVPTPLELAEQWEDYIGGTVMPRSDLLGCLRLPDETPRAFASVDVCEVLRDTHLGLRTVAEVTDMPYTGSIHMYGDGTPITSSEDITTVLQVLMSNAYIRPVENIDRIGDIMRRWRQLGVYVVANTSTLPGCERGTINFFKTHLPDAIDGILLPRNHDGTLPMTKGRAARGVITDLAPEGGPVTAVHIDDAPYHNASFREQVGSLDQFDYGEVRVATFQPDYTTHHPEDPGSVTLPTPLDAFRAADAFLTRP